MSQEEFQALKEWDPYGALEIVFNFDIFSLKVSIEPSTGTGSELSESSKASLLNEFRTQILRVDLSQEIE